MAKAVRVANEELLRVLEAGADYLIVGNRRFLLVEVADPGDCEFYDVTEPDEVKILDEALQDQSRRLSGAEAREYLAAKLREHGIR